ncbi:MAG: ImmA/IrrE family metallo-endopeptidase [Gemmatimonadota bacterium]|nr:ImmA/IrrE family metallo-endopeptidase [Gemmatimonadota bacterium]
MTPTLDYIVPTGEYIAEWMEEAGINAAELSRRLGVTPKNVSELLSGKAPLSHQLALSLERVSGIPARLWNLYESGYRNALARVREREGLEAQFGRAQLFPLSWLRKYGYLKASRTDRAEVVGQLLSILGVGSFDALDETWAKGSIAYRRAAVNREDAPALITWLALADRYLEELIDLPAYNREGLKNLIPRLRSLTAAEDLRAAVDEAVGWLRSVGVVLCFTPPISGLGIHGATRWVKEHPLIQLSLRGKSDDQLWFTLFHELGHVLLHSPKELFLHEGSREAEEEADEFASRILVPPEYHARLPRKRDLQAIRDLASEMGIAPSIVLGQAQRITNDYSWGHALKRKLEWVTGTNHSSK